MAVKKSLANLILLALEKTVDGYISFEDFIYNPGLYVGGMREVSKSALSHSLKRLRENGFIELIGDEELMLRLTDSGKDKALWTKMRMSDEKWDGKWRLVFWDIPEKRRKARDLLRHKLKQLGFMRIQKSVWTSKKDCLKILRDYIKQVGIEDWVVVVETDNLSR